MDWTRTKTILIIALILTNGVLIFSLYGDRIGADNLDEQKFKRLEEVISLLKSEDVYITSDIPTHDLYLPDVQLTYEMYENEELIKILLNKGYSKVDGRYLSKNAEVQILGAQELVYRTLNVPGGFVKTDPDTAKSVADAFLSEKGLTGESVEYWGTKTLDNGMALVQYRQTLDGHFVEDASMDFKIAGNQLAEFRRKWFGSFKTLETIKNIESPVKALFRLLPEIDSSSEVERPVKIVSMDLGYRLVSNILTINFQEGEPSPYWRFKTESGEVIYIEAQTDE